MIDSPDGDPTAPSSDAEAVDPRGDAPMPAPLEEERATPPPVGTSGSGSDVGAAVGGAGGS